MTGDARLPTALWLTGAIRRIQDQGGACYILKRGEEQSGMVCVLHRTRAALAVYVQERNAVSVLGWRRVSPKNQGERMVEEAWATDYSARAAARDPDLWIVEIETARPDFPLEGPVLL